MAPRPSTTAALSAALRQPGRFLLAGITTIAVTLIACGPTLSAPPPPARHIAEASSQAEVKPHALQYVPGSTNKVEQLIGDYDVASGQRTFDQTATRPRAVTESSVPTSVTRSSTTDEPTSCSATRSASTAAT